MRGAAVIIEAVARRQKVCVIESDIRNLADITAVELDLTFFVLEIGAGRCHVAAKLHRAVGQHFQSDRIAALTIFDGQIAIARNEIVAIAPVVAQTMAVEVERDVLVRIEVIRQRQRSSRRDDRHGAAVQRVFNGVLDRGIVCAVGIHGHVLLVGQLLGDNLIIVNAVCVLLIPRLVDYSQKLGFLHGPAIHLGGAVKGNAFPKRCRLLQLNRLFRTGDEQVRPFKG